MHPIRRNALLSLAVSLLAVGPATAQSPAPPPAQIPAVKPVSVEDAVHLCVKQVRQALPAGRFDAHVSPRGMVRSSGSDDESARFKLCMQQGGHQVN